MVVGLKVGRESVEPSAPRELFPLSGGFWGSVYALAPDGKRILVNRIMPDFAALEAIVNWPALLKKCATTNARALARANRRRFASHRRPQISNYLAAAN